MAVAEEEFMEGKLGVIDPERLRQGRVDLAAAFRIAERHGLHEGICNHFSLAVAEDAFLLNLYGQHWSEVSASELLLVDSEARLIAGKEAPEPTAFFIHSRIHRHNPDAICVLHTHMPHATALTLVDPGRLEMVSQNACRFHERIAYYEDYRGLVLDPEEGDRICEALGDCHTLFLANHGVICIGRSVAEAYDRLYYLERAAQAQILAHATGQRFRPIHPETVALTRDMIEQEAEGGASERHFAALKRVLDRDLPGYAD